MLVTDVYLCLFEVEKSEQRSRRFVQDSQPTDEILALLRRPQLLRYKFTMTTVKGPRTLSRRTVLSTHVGPIIPGLSSS